MFYLRDLFNHTMWANQTANGRSGRSHSPPPDIPTLTQNLQDECLQWRLQIVWHHLLDLQALHSLPMQHFNVYASCHMLSVALIPILKIHLIYDPLFKDILFCIKYYCLLRVYFRDILDTDKGRVACHAQQWPTPHKSNITQESKTSVTWHKDKCATWIWVGT